jgi:hypothetical protein
MVAVQDPLPESRRERMLIAVFCDSCALDNFEFRIDLVFCLILQAHLFLFSPLRGRSRTPRTRSGLKHRFGEVA